LIPFIKCVGKLVLSSLNLLPAS